MAVGAGAGRKVGLQRCDGLVKNFKSRKLFPKPKVVNNTGAGVVLSGVGVGKP